MTMNKWIASGLIATGLLAGCAQSDAAPAKPVEVAGNRVAVVYFSWSPSGNTRFAAQTIAAKAGAKLFEIKPERPYSTDFRTCCEEAKPEFSGKRMRPIRAIPGLDLAQYDVIFIGTPNWFGTMAPPVWTFVAQNAAALKGKTVCIFVTHGSGGMQRVGKEFAGLVPDSNVLPAQAFPGSTIRDNVAALEKFVTDRIKEK